MNVLGMVRGQSTASYSYIVARFKATIHISLLALFHFGHLRYNRSVDRDMNSKLCG